LREREINKKWTEKNIKRVLSKLLNLPDVFKMQLVFHVLAVKMFSIFKTKKFGHPFADYML
jgi:hypothetical protein